MPDESNSAGWEFPNPELDLVRGLVGDGLGRRRPAASIMEEMLNGCFVGVDVGELNEDGEGIVDLGEDEDDAVGRVVEVL